MISDLIVVAFLIGSVILGYKTGFIKSVFKFFSGIISLFLAIGFYKPFSEFMSNTALASNIYEKISMNVYKLIIVPDVQINSRGDVSNLILDTMHIPNPMKESILDSMPQNVAIIDNNQICRLISGKLTTIIVQLISVILLFILVRVALWVVRIILDRIFKLPILNQINKLVGLGLGFIQGMFVIYIVLGVLVVLKNNFIINTINNSYITNYLYYNNLIIDLIF